MQISSCSLSSVLTWLVLFWFWFCFAMCYSFIYYYHVSWTWVWLSNSVQSYSPRKINHCDQKRHAIKAFWSFIFPCLLFLYSLHLLSSVAITEFSSNGSRMLSTPQRSIFQFWAENTYVSTWQWRTKAISIDYSTNSLK